MTLRKIIPKEWCFHHSIKVEGKQQTGVLSLVD